MQPSGETACLLSRPSLYSGPERYPANQVTETDITFILYLGETRDHKMSGEGDGYRDNLYVIQGCIVYVLYRAV